MRLGLLGYPIAHSKSPELYQRFLGNKLKSYDLFPFENVNDIPDILFFAERLDGLNITSPYKRHFIDHVKITSPLVQSLGAINTILFKKDMIYATNTDLEAVEEILTHLKNKFKDLHILLLGDGSMANLTKVVAGHLSISVRQFSRRMNDDFDHLDLSLYSTPGLQTLIINSCSRDYVFNGKIFGSEIFWDYNYSFAPHQTRLTSKVMTYIDGQELLELQARAAIKFWKKHTPKLN